MIDAHTHLQDPMIWESESWENLQIRWKSAGVDGAVICGCWSGDWEDVRRLAEKSRNGEFSIYPQFGVHPWWVEKEKKNWENNLKIFLHEYPIAGVGEIGLDSHFPGLAPMDKQIEFCEKQLLIANEFQRPVTMHCLKAHNELLAILKKHKLNNIKILMHMFTGSVEYVNAYCKFSPYIYFSVFSKGPKESLIEAIPIDRLVVETDSPFQPALPKDIASMDICCLPPQLRSGEKTINDPAQLALSVQRIAKAKKISFDEAVKVTVENTKRAFNI